MKSVEIFYLRGCPYCVKARKALEELKEENGDYGRVPIRWIDEAEEVDYANEHDDYYYVPSVYYNSRKVFEAHPGDSFEKIRNGLKAALDKAVYDGPGEEYISSVKEQQ